MRGLGADFRRQWLAQSASMLGDQVSYVAIPLVAVLALNASVGRLGWLVAAGRFPGLAVALLAGAYADRTSRRTLMIASDVVRGLAVLSLPVAAAFGTLTFGHLLAVAVVTSVMGTLFDVSAAPMVADVVGGDDLVRAYGWIETSRSATTIAGPSATGLLLEVVAPVTAVAADAVSYFVSALTLARIRHRAPAVGSGPPEPVGAAIRAGARHVLRHPVLRVTAACTAIYNVALYAVQALVFLYLTRRLGLGTAQIGLVLSATGVGFLAGATLAPRLRVRLGPRLVLASVGAGLGLLLVPAAASLPAPVALLAVAQFLTGVSNQVIAITCGALYQVATPPPLRARTTATVRTLAWSMIPFGALGGAAVASRYGLVPALWAAGVVALVPPFLMAASPVRRLRAVSDVAR
jgi:MFS family permease